MKYLKTILAIIYPILIILLLLNNCKGCNREEPKPDSDSTIVRPPRPEPQPEPRPEPIDSPMVDTTRIDSARAVDEARNVGEMGDLKVTLLWSFWGDIDLRVLQPNGKEIYWNDKTDTSTGGRLDHDDWDGGIKEGKPSAENIYWTNPPKGQYQVTLKYYGSSKLNQKQESGTCTVIVFRNGEADRTYEVDMMRKGDEKEVCTINVD